MTVRQITFNREFKKAQQKKVETARLKRKAKSLKSKGINAGVITNPNKDPELVIVDDAPIIAVQKDKKGKVIRELTKFDVLQEKNKALLVKKPVSSYEVTKKDGSKVYRTSGTNAQGKYVNEIATRIKENKPNTGSYEVTKKDGSKVYRTSGTNAQGKYVNETPAYELFSQSKTIETPKINNPNIEFENNKKVNELFQQTQTTKYKILDKISNIPALGFLDPKKKLLKEVKILENQAPESFKNASGLISKAQNTYNSKILQSFKEGFTFKETAERRIKGGSPFEAISYTGGAVIGIAINKVGEGVGYLGSKVISKSPKLYKFTKTVGTVLNNKIVKPILFTVYGVSTGVNAYDEIKRDGSRGAVRSSVNVIKDFSGITGIFKGSKKLYQVATDKYSTTDIKGIVTGFQDTTVSRAKGIFKDQPYSEIITSVGKNTYSQVNIGNNKIITAQSGDTGTFKILKETTKLKVDRVLGIIPKKFRLVKELSLVKKGTFKPTENAKLNFEKAKISQDNLFQIKDATKINSNIRYDEKAFTRGTLNKDINNNLKFQLELNKNVKTEFEGVVTDQVIQKIEIDYKRNSLLNLADKNKNPFAYFENKQDVKSINIEYKTPKVVFSNKPNPKDSISFDLTDKGYKIKQIAEPIYTNLGDKLTQTIGQYKLSSNNLNKINKNVKVSNSELDRISALVRGNIKPTENIIKNNEIKPKKPKKINTEVNSIGINIKPQIQANNKLIFETETITQPVYNIPTQTEINPINIQAPNTKILNQINTNKIISPITKTNNILDIKTIPTSKIEYKSILTTKQNNKAVNINKIKTENIINNKVDTKIRSNVQSKIKSIIQSNIKPVLGIKSITSQIQEQIQINKPISVYSQKFLKPAEFININNKPPRISKFGLGFSKDFQQNKQRGFDVLVRKKGLFEKITNKALSKQEAINFGTFEVGNTARASFKIIESDNKNIGSFKGKGIIEDFYINKDNIFIEKRGRRIKSEGELKEITFKGIATNKNKNIFGGF